MSGGEALDLALGLLRAPARRTHLAARPLPTGMTTLLEVAGGSESAAQAASAATGGSQAHLNMQPFLTLSFCIALQGIFPSPT